MFARFFFLANLFLFMTSTHRTVLLYFHFPCWDLNFLNQANSDTGIPQLYTLSIGNCLFYYKNILALINRVPIASYPKNIATLCQS